MATAADVRPCTRGTPPQPPPTERRLCSFRRVGIVWPEASRGRLVASSPGAPFSDDRAAAPPRFPGAPCGRRGPRS